MAFIQSEPSSGQFMGCLNVRAITDPHAASIFPLISSPEQRAVAAGQQHLDLAPSGANGRRINAT